MKKYDFDKVINRRSSDSAKWNPLSLKERFGYGELLPLWTADMDFQAPEEVIEALRKRVEHGLYGYTIHSQTMDEAIISWLKNRWDLDVSPESMLFTSGAVMAITQLIQVFTEPGDSILIQPPVYFPFRSSIELNNRQVIKSPLIISQDSVSIDFESLENVISKHRPKMMLLCNPHNPLSRVWKKGELEQLASILNKYNVFLVSDEIHGDLTFNNHRHYSWGRVENAAKDGFAIIYSPSKTFSLAGLPFTTVIIPDREKRKMLGNYLMASRIGVDNVLTYAAVEAAYTHGAPWLNNVKKYIWDNYKYLVNELEKRLPKAWVAPLQGTYLAWINFEAYGIDEELASRFINEAKLALVDGQWFGDEGLGSMRINLACPRSVLEEAIDKMCKLF
ncbi:MAG: pyridoxal phosphate-dependent aminotransferase [Tissierellia bacterium]|nr:pyridoxal phosphate-dependent aminotransferase [Tissierellia bacterium]